jgi:hypothetical protein
MSEENASNGRSAWATPAGIGAIVAALALVLGLITFYLANRPGGKDNPGPPGETASITVSPSYGPVGTGYLVSVSQFDEGERIRLSIDDEPFLDLPETPSSGRSGIPLPTFGNPGRYVIQAEGLTSQRKASTILVISSQ